jgi:hypothetical protein
MMIVPTYIFLSLILDTYEVMITQMASIIMCRHITCHVGLKQLERRHAEEPHQQNLLQVSLVVLCPRHLEQLITILSLTFILLPSIAFSPGYWWPRSARGSACQRAASCRWQ